MNGETTRVHVTEDFILPGQQHSQKKSTDSVNSVSKSQLPFLAETDKLILRFIWKFKAAGLAKTILKKHKAGRVTLPNFKTYYKAMLVKTVWS